MGEASAIVAPSVLSADFADIAGGLARIQDSGADWVHLDVMDGRFVPTITFGPKMVADIRKRISLPLDVHLMITEPENHIQDFAEAGADYLTVHLEATIHAHRVIQQIRDCGCAPGISIVPSTPVSALSEILDDLDQVLIMTVNPGFGGQSLIPQCVDKVRELAKMRKERGADFHIAVDGGINRSTASMVREAGANVLISGSAFFASDQPEHEVRLLKGLDLPSER